MDLRRSLALYRIDILYPLPECRLRCDTVSGAQDGPAFADAQLQAGLSTAASSYPGYAVWLVVFGIGFALALPSLTAAFTAALPPEQAGVGEGCNPPPANPAAPSASPSSAPCSLSHFIHRLPHAAHSHGGSPRTVPAALAAGPNQHRDVINAFTHSAAAPLHTAAVLLLVTGALITIQLIWSHQRSAKSENTAT